MSYYKLNDRCVFVDPFEEDGRTRPPHPHPPTEEPVRILPQIIDKRPPGQPDRYEFHELTETAAYILRYLLLKVDKAVISAMMVAEFHPLGSPHGHITPAQADAEIDKLINDLTSRPRHLLIEVHAPLPCNKPLEPSQTTGPYPFTQPLPVDFSVGTNQLGWIVFKGVFT